VVGAVAEEHREEVTVEDGEDGEDGEVLEEGEEVDPTSYVLVSSWPVFFRS
jgi:hypothetical protein